MTKIGKFWHRHRRPRPVTYNADPDFHSGVKPKETEGTKTPAGKRKGAAAAALRAQSTAADISEPQTPARSTNGGNGDTGSGEPSSRKSPTPSGALNKDDDDRAISPVSTSSSASEPPLAQKVKMNGNHSTTKRPTTPPPPVPISALAAPSTPVKQQSLDLPMSNSVAPPSSGPAAVTNTSPSRTTVRFHFFLSSNETSFFNENNIFIYSYLNGYPVPCKP